MKRESETTQEGLVIGRSLVIKGDLSGVEDLVIDGRVDGSVNLEGHQVTVAGEVNGHVFAKSVIVIGRIHGDVMATGLLEVRETGKVEGDVIVSQLRMEAGAEICGSVDMSEHPSRDSEHLKLVKA